MRAAPNIAQVVLNVNPPVPEEQAFHSPSPCAGKSSTVVSSYCGFSALLGLSGS